MLKFEGYKGILFVGDPHLWSKKPGRRTDADFTATVLNKINQAVDIAIKENLYLIILGDLFHAENENNIETLTKLIRILKKLPDPCASVVGNHDRSQIFLSDDVTMSLLREAGAIYTLEKNDIEIQMTINNKTILIGSTPYGDVIPDSVNLPEGIKKAFIIWLTHENLDFGESYPGVIPIKEIKGVSMLVNGHIHKTKKPKKVGNMVAHNPGNITRLSIDCVDHIPTVWKWIPEQGQELKPIVLNYNKKVFNILESQIEVDITSTLVKDELTPKQTSLFVEKMEQELLKDQDKTDDGSYIKQNIKTLAQVMQLDSDFVNELIEIAEEVLEEEK